MFISTRSPSISVLFSFLLLLQGCGNFGIGLGGGNGPNDARPNGRVIYQGTFNGQNSQTVSGSAQIFRSGTTYILRLEGISTPTESGMTVQVYGSPGGRMINTPLRDFTGNQNYTVISSGLNIVFDNVYIFSTINNRIYGAAQLSEVGLD